MERMGCYSVKSAYSLLQASRNYNHMEDNSGFWRLLWNLKILPKVKNFLRRACSNCLPTKDLLIVRRVSIKVICPICNEVPESILHILVLCPYASMCLGKLSISAVSGDFYTFSEWLQHVLNRGLKPQVHKLSMMCWMV